MKLESVVGSMKKEHGDSAVTKGSELVDVERLPTGVFPFDLASGGGFPRGRTSIIFGPESSGKTNLALMAIALEQKINPEMQNVFVDVERSYDAKWAARLGVDTGRLTVLHPEYAEQAVDMVDAVMQADDVSIVVLDSIAAMMTANEGESSAEKASVGGSSAVVGKLVRKATTNFGSQKRKGLFPTLLLINQIRHKIGVMFGDPETMPGGNSLKFASGLTVRLYGKGKVVKEIHPAIPAYKETKGVIKKHKVPIVSTGFEYDMLMIPHEGHMPGHCEDWNTVSNYLRNMGGLGKTEDGKAWVMLGEEFKTLTAAKASLYSDVATEQKVKSHIIEKSLEAIYEV